MAKNEKSYYCTNCAYETSKWLGQCSACGEWGTLQESEFASIETGQTTRKINISKISEVEINTGSRFSSSFAEVDRVLGGGFVNGSVILISGEPGIGKSTLLMQIACNLSKSNKKVLYVSAEESSEQLALRARRIDSDMDIDVTNAYELEGILNSVKKGGYTCLIVDSIQTIYTSSTKGFAGGVAQMRHCTSELVKFAKEEKVTVIMVGQKTKDGLIAGPKVLEHLVDVVTEIEGDKKYGFRILRSSKNRFGNVNEVGIFHMTEKGLIEVENPSLISENNEEAHKMMPGVCYSLIMEGNRPLIVEVQALTVKTGYALPKRLSEGINHGKLELLVALIQKYLKISLLDQDIYVKVANGISINDPGIDLAVILAIISSTLQKNLPDKLIACAEVSLTGQINKVLFYAERMKEAKRLHYVDFYKLHPAIKRIHDLTRVF